MSNEDTDRPAKIRDDLQESYNDFNLNVEVYIPDSRPSIGCGIPFIGTVKMRRKQMLWTGRTSGPNQERPSNRWS